MAEHDEKGPLGGPLSNRGQIGGGGPGLSGSRDGPGENAPAGADDRYPVDMGDDDRSHSGETAGSGFAASGATTEAYDGQGDDLNAARTRGANTGPSVPDPSEPDVGGAGDFQTYDPSVVEVNRNRLQGVGAEDIDRQRNPTRFNSSEQYGRTEGNEE